MREIHIKNPHRRLGNENADTRMRRIHAEQALIRAYRKDAKEAAAASLGKVIAARNAVEQITLKQPDSQVEELKTRANRLSKECDRMLARKRMEAVAEEMVRIKLAKWVTK